MSGKTPLRKRVFVAGTDTGVGKTLVSEALLVKAGEQGYRTLGLKPLAAGAVLTADGWRNDDALRLQRAASVQLPYQQVNPVLLEEAVAPHVAAARQGRKVSLASLAGYVRGAMTAPHDLLVVEGAGGWRVPLNERELLSQLPQALGLEVILVVGLRLGCLNHALLTAEAIRQDGLVMAGWVATQIEPGMAAVEENLATLERMIAAPCLGFVPYRAEITAAEAAGYIHWPRENV